MIPRLTVVDDTGDKTSGTAITAAWWTSVEDMIDGRWSVRADAIAGGFNDYATLEADVVFMSNPSALTLAGILAPATPAKPGKTFRLFNTGSAPITFLHASTLCLATSRLIHYSSASVVLNPLGCVTYVYAGAPGGNVWFLASVLGGA